MLSVDNCTVTVEITLKSNIFLWGHIYSDTLLVLTPIRDALDPPINVHDDYADSA